MKKNMPCTLEGERAVLNCILTSPNVLEGVTGYLGKRVFYDSSHSRLYEIIVNMISKGEPIDIVTIIGNLSDEDVESGVDQSFIVDIFTNSLTTPANIKFYARQIYEKYLHRQVINKCTDIVESAMDTGSDVYKLMTGAYDMMGRLIECQPTAKLSIEDMADETIDSIQNSSVSIIKTGFHKLDDLSGGMTRGEITILGGRPGHGKTTTMLNVVKSCIDNGLKVMVINREMTNIEMLKKLMVLESGKLSYLNVRRGMVGDLETSAELDRVKRLVVEKYSEDRFAMFDNLNTFEQSSAEARRFKPDIIFDDYIQLISSNQKFDHRRFQLEKLVNDYKWLSKSLNCASFLLSQLNRGIEHRGDGRPKLSDIAESGAIEQVAENVFFVYYDFKINGMASKFGANKIEVVGSKVRYGNSGNILLDYNGDKVKLGE